MGKRIAAFIALGMVAAFGFASQARADTVLFSDNFDGQVIANPPPDGGFNYNSFTNWNVTGEVDLIGLQGVNNFFNFPVQAGHGLYVDLTGTPNVGGITSKSSFGFATGTNYVLTFDLANNVGNTTNSVAVSIALGGQTYTFTTPQQTYSFATFNIAFAGNNSNTPISFTESDGNNDSQGVLLDNVVLTQVSPVGAGSSTPLPSSMWAGVAMLAGLAIAGGVRKRRRTQ